MNILTSVGPGSGSVSHVGVSELPHLHSDASTRTSSRSESKAVLNKLLTSYPILVANKLASKYRSVASVHTMTYGTAPAGYSYCACSVLILIFLL